MPRRLAPLLAAALAFGLGLSAKPVLAQASLRELPAAARAAGLTFALPRIDELRFDTAGSGANAHVAYDLAWRHRRGAFELLARVVPAGSPSALHPGVSTGALVTHCQRNDPDESEAFVARWRAGTEDLARLGAEWAVFHAYAPKPSFSQRRRCYQASYYRAGRGLVHVWLLYDDPALLHSDWVYVLPFATEEG